MPSQWLPSSGLLKFYYILNLIFLLVILLVKWQAFLFLPLFYIPVLFLFCYGWMKNYQELDVKLTAYTYVLSNSVGVIIVVIVQTILGSIIGIICFGSKEFFELLQEIQDINPSSYKEMKNIKVDKTFGFYVFLFFLAFLIAAGVEETLKYKMVDRIKRMTCINYQSVLGYQICAITAALGFSIMENVGFQLAAGFKTDTTILDLLLTAIERIFIAIPVHCLCGYLIGLRLIRRDIFKQPLSFFDVMKWSVFVHGNFDFWLIMIATHDVGSASIALSGLVVIFTFVAAYCVVGRERKTVADLQSLDLNK